MDYDALMQQVRGFRAPDGPLRLTSFLSNVAVAVVFLLAATAGFLTTVRKITSDRLGPGLMTHYQVVDAVDLPRAEFQRLWNYTALLKIGVLKWAAIPVFLALGSHELWLRTINDAALRRGKSLKASYRSRFRRCHTQWASISQLVLVVALVLPVLAAAVLVTFGAWMVEDNNSKAGISFPLSALNNTLYFAPGAVPRDIVDQKNGDFTSPGWFLNSLSLLREKGLINIANPPVSYHSLYPEDTLDVPDEMRKTAYYLPRSSFPQLEAYLEKSLRQKMYLPEPPAVPDANTTTRGFRFGDAIFNDMMTMGIGINVSSYERFMGDGMPGLPRDFILGGMLGQVYGNAVNVKCLDITGDYQVSFSSDQSSPDEGEDPRMNYIFTKKRSFSTDEEPQEQHHFTVPFTSSSGPLVFSHLSLSGKEPLPLSVRDESDPYGIRPREEYRPFVFNNAPLQTLFIIPPPGKPAPPSSGSEDQKPFASVVLKCIYLPSEFGIEFGVISERLNSSSKAPAAGETTGKAGPLKFMDPLRKYNAYRRGPRKQRAGPRKVSAPEKPAVPSPRCVNPIYALPAARAVHELLTNPTPDLTWPWNAFHDHNNNGTTNTAASAAGGGVLRQALAEYYQRKPPTPSIRRWETRHRHYLREVVIEPVLGATASAYFSLLRQRVEIANLWVPFQEQASPSSLSSSKSTVPQSETPGLEGWNVSKDALVKGMVFWVLRIGGSAPFGLHYVGCLVLFWIGIRALIAAWRTAIFGKGERYFGRWWEEGDTISTTGLEDMTSTVAEKVKEVEKGESVGDVEPLLGSFKDEETC